MTTRGLTPAEEGAAAGRNSVVVQLVELLFDSGALRLAVGRMPVEWAGTTWYAARSLALDTAAESADGLEGFKASLEGLSMDIVAIAAGEPYFRRPLNLYEIYLDAETYQPLAAPKLEWPGRITALGLTEQGRMVAVGVTAERADAEEHRPRLDYYNDASQRRRYPADTGFSQVEQMTEITLVWPNKKALG